MAATGWFWEQIDQRAETTPLGGAIWSRNNWNLARFRRSNAAFASELNDTADSLTANNGGVDEVVSAPSDVGALEFDFSGIGYNYPTVSGAGTTAVNGAYSGLGTLNSNTMYDYGGYYIWFSIGSGGWNLSASAGGVALYKATCSDTSGIADFDPWDASLTWTVGTGAASAPTLAGTAGSLACWGATGDRWVQSGVLHNGLPVYVPYRQPNRVYPGYVNAAWYSKTGISDGKWCIAPMLPSEISGNSFEDEANITNYPDAYARSTTESTSIDGLVFDGYADWSDIDANCEATAGGTVQMFFVCVSDKRTYPNPFTDHYLQRQEWEYQDNWVQTV